jgi:hypothetical protein
MSYGFQQYSDVTVMGVAGKKLALLVNQNHPRMLIYESAVAPIRQPRTFEELARLQGAGGPVDPADIYDADATDEERDAFAAGDRGT